MANWQNAQQYYIQIRQQQRIKKCPLICHSLSIDHLFNLFVAAATFAVVVRPIFGFL